MDMNLNLNNSKTWFWAYLCTFSLILFRASAVFVIGLQLCNEVKAAEASLYEKQLELVRTLMINKNFEEADIVLSFLIAKNPNAEALYYERGIIRHESMHKWEAALLDYDKVIKLNPKFNPKVYWRRGLCFYVLGDPVSAIKDYDKCLSLMPRYDRVYFYRAKAYGKLGMFAQAKRDFDQAVKYGPEYALAAKTALEKMLAGETDF